MIIKNILPILFFLFFGCGKTDKVKNISLTSEPTGFGNYLGKASSLTILGHYLIVEDNHTETAYTVFDLNIDTIFPIYTGHKGAGPDEMINPKPIVPSGDNFYVYDVSHFKLFLFHADSIKQENYKPKINISIEDKLFISDVKKISSKAFVSVGIFSGKRFVFTDSQGKTINETGNYPIESVEQIPYHVKGMACLSRLATNVEKGLMASAMFYGDNIQFYEVSDNYEIKLRNQHCTFLPEFTTNDYGGTPNFSPTQNTRWGYLSLTSNNDYVYALYSGKYQRDGVDFYQANVVHVFDWYGKLISEILLDKEAQSIATNQEYLFALYEGENGYDIAKYKL